MGTNGRMPDNGSRRQGNDEERDADLLIQCRRCHVRLTGSLAGWHADILLPGYRYVLCLACRAELARKYDGRAFGGGPPFDLHMLLWRS